MLNILTIIGPLFLTIAIGYVAVRQRLFKKAEIGILGRFVIQIALPALLFKSLAERSFETIINLDYLLAYGLGSLLSLLLCLLLASRIEHASRALLGMVAVGGSLSNTAFIGFPLITQFIGPQGTVPLALSFLVENLLILPLALAIAESGSSSGQKFFAVLAGVAKSLLKNPLLIAIMLGLVCALLEFELPEIVTRVVSLLAGASSPVALFVIGGTLVGLRVGGEMAPIGLVVLGKLVLHPLAVAAMMLVFVPAEHYLVVAGVLIAALPMFSIFPIIAQKYQQQGWCASALMLTTIASALSLSLVLFSVS